jgi:hypothetical protein
LICCRFERPDTVEKQCGGQGVSQSRLKDKAFLTLLGQNLPFELRRKLAFRLQSFSEIDCGSSKYWPNPSISVGGGQQAGWRLSSRRKSHSPEIMSVHQFLFVMQDDVPSAQRDRSCEILICAEIISPEISVLAAPARRTLTKGRPEQPAQMRLIRKTHTQRYLAQG